MGTLEALKDLSALIGPAGAVAAVGWFFEHRARKSADERNYKMAVAMLRAIGKFEAQLEGIKEAVRNNER